MNEVQKRAWQLLSTTPAVDLLALAQMVEEIERLKPNTVKYAMVKACDLLQAQMVKDQERVDRERAWGVGGQP